MKRLKGEWLRIPLIVTAVLFGAATLIAGPTASIQLALDEQTVLPGTPTGITLTVTNSGDTLLRVPPAIWLVATDQHGRHFLVDPHQPRRGMSIAVPEESRDVPPGESHEIRFDVHAIETAPWLTDHRLSTPGRYRLRVIFADEVRPDGQYDVNPEGEFDRSRGLISSEATLDVAAQSDDDRAVWAWMQRVAGGGWGATDWMAHASEFAKLVTEHYPKSNYALYAAVWYPQHEGNDKYALLEDVIARYPKASITQSIKLGLIIDHEHDAAVASHRHDLTRTADEWDKARAIATDLAQNARSAVVREAAQKYAAEMPTREQVLHPPHQESDN